MVSYRCSQRIDPVSGVHEKSDDAVVFDVFVNSRCCFVACKALNVKLLLSGHNCACGALTSEGSKGCEEACGTAGVKSLSRSAPAHSLRISKAPLTLDSTTIGTKDFVAIQMRTTVTLCSLVRTVNSGCTTRYASSFPTKVKWLMADDGQDSFLDSQRAG